MLEREFQYRKRYGLHAMAKNNTRKTVYIVSIPQAVWIACNEKAYKFSPCFPSFQYRKRYGLHAISLSWMLRTNSLEFQYRKRYGLHAIPSPKGRGVVAHWGFNTASGMDCMQYRPSQPLGQLNPEAGFLNGSLFWQIAATSRDFFVAKIG